MIVSFFRKIFGIFYLLTYGIEIAYEHIHTYMGARVHSVQSMYNLYIIHEMNVALFDLL